MTYFKTRNATVPVNAGKVTVDFTPAYHVGGGWVGFYFTDNEAVIAGLKKNPAVEVIHELEFDLLKKKLTTQSPDSNGLQQIPQDLLQKGSVVVEAAKETPVVTGLNLKSVEKPDDGIDTPKRRGRKAIPVPTDE